MVLAAWWMAVLVSATHPEVPPAWDDAGDVATSAAMGTVEVCESLATPVGWIPTYGTVLSIVWEWACLAPGAVAGDYVQRQHGTQRGYIWQGMLGLGLGKLWRDATRVLVAASVIAGGVAMVGALVVTSGVLSVTVWPVAPLFLPLAVAGALMGGALTYTLVREFRKSVQELIYKGTFRMLTGSYPSVPDQRHAQRTHWMRPRHNIVEHNLYLAALAAGVEAEHSPVHWIPLVGPIVRAKHKAEHMEEVLVRAGAQDLGAKPLHAPSLRAVIRLLTGAEGVLGALVQGTLLAGAVLLVGGCVLMVVQAPLGAVKPTWGLPQPEAWARTWLDAALRGGPLALLTGLLGVAALAVVAHAVIFVGLREVPKILTPWVVPLVFGVLPPDGLFPPRIPRETPNQPAPPAALDAWPATPAAESMPAEPAPAEPAPVQEAPADPAHQ